MSKRVFIYCRQSSGRESDSASILFQEERCRAYAATHGYDVLGVFGDANTPGRLYPTGAEGVSEQDLALQEWLESHTTEKRYRAGLGELFRRLGEVDGLLVYDTTRLYRPVQQSFLASYINHRLISAGVAVLSVKEGRIDLRRFTDNLVSSIQQQVNDNQIALSREKSKLALVKLRDSGYYPTMPKMYGVRYVGGRERRVELIPEQVEVIRFIYEQVLALTPYAELLRELNRRYGERAGGRGFYDTNWRHIIANPFYCGYMYDSHGKLIPAQQMQGQEVVSYRQWCEANAIVGRHRGSGHPRLNAVHPFTGLMHCGECGRRLSVVVDGLREGYVCVQGQRERNERCNKSRVNITLSRHRDECTGLRQAVLPLLVLALYGQLKREESGAGDLSSAVSEIEQELSRTVQRQDELAAAYARGEVQCYAAYERAYRHLEERHVSLHNQLLQLRQQQQDLAGLTARGRVNLQEVPAILAGGISEVRFRELLHEAIHRIDCHEEHVDIATMAGGVTLPRLRVGTKRNFPPFTYDFSGEGESLSGYTLTVIYHYDSRRKRRLAADFGGVKIFLQ